MELQQYIQNGTCSLHKCQKNFDKSSFSTSQSGQRNKLEFFKFYKFLFTQFKKRPPLFCPFFLNAGILYFQVRSISKGLVSSNCTKSSFLLNLSAVRIFGNLSSFGLDGFYWWLLNVDGWIDPCYDFRNSSYKVTCFNILFFFATILDVVDFPMF